MTNTISVPRELLERIVGKCKLSVLGDDHAKVWELLTAAPKADVQEPVAVMHSDGSVAQPTDSSATGQKNQGGGR